MKTVKDLHNSEQALLYNDKNKEFQQYYNNTEVKKHLRIGQAFYNFFYKTIYFKPSPSLFYETDNRKAIKLMENDLVEYVLKINNGGQK